MVKPPRRMLPASQLEKELKERGFRKLLGKQSRLPDDVPRIRPSSILPRYTFERGNIRVLTESREQPYRTVQEYRSGTTAWYVDFPMQIPDKAILAFLTAIHEANVGNHLPWEDEITARSAAEY